MCNYKELIMAVIDKPELPPLLFNRNGDYTYVCTYKNVWNSKLGRAVREKGKNNTVGKIIGGKLEGQIEWNPDFITRFPILEKLKVVRVKDLSNSKGKRPRYKLEFSQAEDLEDLEDNSLFIRKATSLKVLHAGTTWLLDNIVANTPLLQALYRTFDKYNAAQKLLSLAYFKVIEADKSMYLYEDFASHTRLPFHRPLDISSITRFLQHIDDNKIDIFLKKLNELCKEDEDSQNQNVYYALDSTSISTYAKDMNYVEWGHNKDLDELQQLNVVMLVNQRTGCPLYYRVYAGATPDVSTVMHLMKEYARMGLNRKAILVADRGYSSVKNINKMYQDNQSFLFNMKTCFNVCRRLITNNLNTLLDDCNYNRRLGQNVVTEYIEWSYPGNYNTNTKRCKKEKGGMYVHIYLDHSIRNETDDKFREKLCEILEKQKANVNSLTNDETEFLNRFTTTDAKGKIVVNNTEKFRYMLTKGIRILVSDIISDPIEASIAYTERNEVEVGFRKLKDFSGARRLHISSSKTLTGKLFVHFLACSILCMLRRRINNAIDNGSSLPFSSEVKMISALSNITQTVFPEGGYFSEVVGKKKELFEMLNIPLPEVEMNIEYEEDNNTEEII